MWYKPIIYFPKKIKTELIKDLIRQITKAKGQRFYLKYILISTIGYIFNFTSLFVMVDLLDFNRRISFIIVYGLVYIFLYSVQLKYLFAKKHDSYKLFRYLIAIVLFYISANIFYNLGLYFGIHYLISTALTIVILMPLRIIVYSRFVYKD